MRPAPGRLVTFIVHGLSDSSASFQDLRNNLLGQDGWIGVAPLRVVDASFNFDGCEPIERGAAKLASHVGKFIFRSGDRIAFIAHSMGGLMVRRMLADGLLNTGIPVVGLVTLGTPHLGYPYISFDDSIKCASQVQQMKSRLIDDNPLLEGQTLSPFMQDLYRRWNPAQVGYRWFAVGGAFCDTWLRLDPFVGVEGWTPET
jgi:triacylglycerol esterase/lipase EstA (alpha/beta hydrolase family)